MSNLRNVLRFGVPPDQLAAELATFPHTVGEIAALIVSEEDLARLGRWGGEPEPSRWAPPWSGR